MVTFIVGRLGRSFFKYFAWKFGCAIYKWEGVSVLNLSPVGQTVWLPLPDIRTLTHAGSPFYCIDGNSVKRPVPIIPTTLHPSGDVAGIKPRPSWMAIDHSIHSTKAPKLSSKSLKPDTSHRNFCLITSVTSHSLIKSSSFLPKSQKARGLADTEMFNKLNIGLVKPLTWSSSD